MPPVAVEVAGRVVRLSSLDRPLWPDFSKGDLVEYYLRVADVLLPHVRNRPVSLHRFPEGVDGPHFYQTRSPSHPPWIRTQRMHTFRTAKDVDAPVLDDRAGLVWAANLSTIELHPFLSTAEALACPLVVVFDLDPGPPAGMAEACSVALDVRSLLDDLGLASYAKTSGGKGLHVYVPLNTPVTYDRTKAFARAVAVTLTRTRGDVVDRMTRALRTGKVLVDWSQNDAGKSTVAPWSLRAGPRPAVSTPLVWDEVVEGAHGVALGFGPDEALRRIEERGDLFAPVLAEVQELPR